MENKNFIKSIMNRCHMCAKENLMRMTKKQSEECTRYWCYGGKIQEVCKSFDAYGREFIKTGYCPKCQNLLFGTELPVDINSRFIEVTEEIENHINDFYSHRGKNELPKDHLTTEEKVIFLHLEEIEDRYYVENGEIKEFENKDGVVNG